MPRAVASLPINPPVSAVDALRRGVLGEHDLDRLIALFAAAIAEHGIDGHFCAARDDRGQLSPLFGDSPGLLAAAPVAGDLTDGLGASALPIRGAAGERYLMMLAPAARPLDDQAAARIRGYATLYAARGATLHEKSSGPLTACGLSLCERFILGRLLVGDSILDIALGLDRSPAAIESHIADAIAALGVADQPAAVALAARQGWLLTTVNHFSALSPRNSVYYS